MTLTGVIHLNRNRDFTAEFCQRNLSFNAKRHLLVTVTILFTVETFRQKQFLRNAESDEIFTDMFHRDLGFFALGGHGFTAVAFIEILIPDIGGVFINIQAVIDLAGLFIGDGQTAVLFDLQCNPFIFGTLCGMRHLFKIGFRYGCIVNTVTERRNILRRKAEDITVDILHHAERIIR